MNKKLLKRIKSLEDYLGLRYTPADNKDDYADHIAQGYGIMRRVEETLKTKENKPR